MKIETSELIGPALDWTASKAAGYALYKDASLDGRFKRGWWVSGYQVDPNLWIPLNWFDPSRDWGYGGPIIERERITTYAPVPGDPNWSAFFVQTPGTWYGPTPLIAAMRCFVSSRLGDIVEVPDELA